MASCQSNTILSPFVSLYLIPALSFRSGMWRIRNQSKEQYLTQMLWSTWWEESGRPGMQGCWMLYVYWLQCFGDEVKSAIHAVLHSAATTSTRTCSWLSLSRLQRRHGKLESQNSSTSRTSTRTSAALQNTWEIRYSGWCMQFHHSDQNFLHSVRKNNDAIDAHLWSLY